MLQPHGEDAGFEGRDFDGDLVGFELDQRIPGSDSVAFVLEPAGNGRLDDGFPEGGDLYGRHEEMRVQWTDNEE